MFLNRLGLAWGCFARELEPRVKRSDLVEIMAASELWPWGEDALDYRFASLSATIATFCQRAKNPKRYRASQFLPLKRGGSDDRIKPKNKKEAIKMLHSIFGTKK